jgi:hypothetical protein
MEIPAWGQFWALVSASSGAIVLLLIDILVRIWPALSAELERAKKYLVLIGAIIVPMLVQQIVTTVPEPDPVVWQIMLIAGTYAVHELLYRFLQKPVLSKLDERKLPPA